MAARQAKLSVSAAWQVDTGLVSAAFRHWGSWLKAIRAAGVDYQPGRRGRTPEELEKQARAWCARHGPLCSGRLIATDRGLLKALRRRFGNLEDAAEQLKLPYRPLKRKGLTAGEVLRRIAKRIRSGETMIARSVRAGDPGLHYGGCRHFESWGAAREAARRALRARRRSRER